MAITKQELINKMVEIREELIKSNEKVEKLISDFLRELQEAKPEQIEKAIKEYEQKHEEPEVPRKR